jgi:hypothetical protein
LRTVDQMTSLATEAGMLFGSPGDKNYRAPTSFLESFPDPMNLVIAELRWEGREQAEAANLAARAGHGETNAFTELYPIRAAFVAMFLFESAETFRWRQGSRLRRLAEQWWLGRPVTSKYLLHHVLGNGRHKNRCRNNPGRTVARDERGP